MNDTFKRYLVLLRQLARQPSPFDEGVLGRILEHPQWVTERLRERDVHEKVVLAGRLPRTLLGRGGRL